LFCVANLFLWIVPGLTLLLLGPVRGTILPGSIVESIYPFTVFPFEKLFVVDLLNWIMGTPIILAPFDHVSLYFKQFFVLAFVFFVLTFPLIGIQMGVGALYLDEGQPSAQGIVVTLMILLVMRSLSILLLLIDVGNLPDRGGHTEGLVALHALAPNILILTTCALAGVICMALRPAYLKIVPG
jgi:hypothetical protein